MICLSFFACFILFLSLIFLCGFFLCALYCHLRKRGVAAFPMRFSLPFSRARCSAFSCAACAAAFRSFSYALCTAAYPNNYKLLSPLVIRRFPAGENTCTMTFLMRFALPFSQMRCGAFSCAACAATFGSFSYAAFLSRFALPFA